MGRLVTGLAADTGAQLLGVGIWQYQGAINLSSGQNNTYGNVWTPNDAYQVKASNSVFLVHFVVQFEHGTTWRANSAITRAIHYRNGTNISQEYVIQASSTSYNDSYHMIGSTSYMTRLWKPTNVVKDDSLAFHFLESGISAGETNWANTFYSGTDNGTNGYGVENIGGWTFCIEEYASGYFSEVSTPITAGDTWTNPAL